MGGVVHSPIDIGTELDKSGFYCEEGAIPEPLMDDCRAAVTEILTRYGARPISLVQPCKDYPAFAELAGTAQLQDLLPKLSAVGGCVQSGEIYNVIRIVAGRDEGQRAAFAFHYDATVITALVPLCIPEGAPEEAGDFICFPNRRSVRRFSAVNLLDKVFMQNNIARKWYSRLAMRHDPRIKIIRLVPGNIYFFWGYRTYHANFTCAPGNLRATLLFHFGDPHAGSYINKLVLRLRQHRVKRALARA